MALEKIQAMINEVRHQQLVRRTDCPNCGYPLTDSPRGLHCPLGDWQEYILPARVNSERL